MAWKTVPREEAQQSPYFGVRGWLKAFYVVLVIGIIMMLPSLYAPPALHSDPTLSRISTAIIIILWLPFLFLTPKHDSRMPKVTIWCMWISLAVSWVILTPGLLLLSLPDILMSMAFGLVFVLLMSWYFLSSKRVNVTYRSRIQE